MNENLTLSLLEEVFNEVETTTDDKDGKKVTKGFLEDVAESERNLISGGKKTNGKSFGEIQTETETVVVVREEEEWEEETETLSEHLENRQGKIFINTNTKTNFYERLINK